MVGLTPPDCIHGHGCYDCEPVPVTERATHPEGPRPPRGLSGSLQAPGQCASYCDPHFGGVGARRHCRSLARLSDSEDTQGENTMLRDHIWRALKAATFV